VTSFYVEAGERGSRGVGEWGSGGVGEWGREEDVSSILLG